MAIIGVDIGGTKCSVARASDGGALAAQERFPTGAAAPTMARILAAVAAMDPGPEPVFGIACGGPLDAAGGRILSPPNLPGWDDVPICALLEERFGGRAFLMNDANAGVLAEWRFGAGVGCRNVVFLTCGTGLGAGIVCDGRLYEGSTGNSGEIGHVRLSEDGPLGYGKRGSAEGWCSGGGIARRIADLRTAGAGAPAASDARELAAAAEAGDAAAQAVFAESGRRLGQAVAVILDLLDPDVVVLGPLFMRCRRWLEEPLRAELAREALPSAVAHCRVVASPLGERGAELQAIAVAIYHAGGFCQAAARAVDESLAALRAPTGRA